MATTNRKPAALVAAEKKIVLLEKELATANNSKDIWYKDAQESKKEIEGLHDVLTDLGIREYKDDNKYNRIALSVRLFSWAMQLANKKDN